MTRRPRTDNAHFQLSHANTTPGNSATRLLPLLARRRVRIAAGPDHPDRLQIEGLCDDIGDRLLFAGDIDVSASPAADRSPPASLNPLFAARSPLSAAPTRATRYPMCDFSNLGRARVRYDARSVDMSKLEIAEGESSLTNEECSQSCMVAGDGVLDLPPGEPG